MTAVASRRSRNSTSKAAFSAGRGLALILLAIGIGMLLLYVIDDGSTGPANDAAAQTSTVPSTQAPGDTTPETGGTDGGETPPTSRTPGEVRIKVYNASGVAGAAGAMTEKLQGVGYTDALAPGNLPTSATTFVACRAGYEGAEAAALATAVGASATVEAFPDPPPSDVGDAVCIVVLGTS